MAGQVLKTLYLEGGTRPHVLRDGPALRVRARNSADRLYPLRRLANIVVKGQVEWDTDALLACAEAAIPVSFVRRDGSLRARLSSPAGRSLADLGKLVETWFSHPDAGAMYRLWVNTQCRIARDRLRREMDLSSWPADPARLHNLLEQRARRYVRAPQLRSFEQQLPGLIRGEAVRLLAEAGVDSHAPLLLLQGVDLAIDFAVIVNWRLQARKIAYLKKRCASARRAGRARPEIGWRDAIHFFEQRKQETARELRSLLVALYAHLIEESRENAA